MSAKSDQQPAAAPLPGTFRGKPRRCWLRVFWLLVIIGAFLLAAWFFRVPLLTGLARAWVVNEPATRADAVVILGGGLENRPFAAARLFQQGVAPKVLYMEVKLGPAQEMGALPSENEVTRRILLARDVPASALVAIGTDVASTYDESRAVRAWVRQTGAASIIICTDLFHTRRARWIFRHELRDTPVKIYVVPVDPVDYNVNNWWHNEEGLIQFQNELVKSVYYWFKY